MPSLPNWQITLLRAGRVDWPPETNYRSPWQWDRTLESHELWILWRGQGSFWKDEEEFPVTQGNLIWLRPGHTYRVRQDPNHPFGITYLNFDLLNRKGKPLQRPGRKLPDNIEEVDASFAESVGRRIVELLWESYIEQRVRGGHEEGSVATPFFTDEDEMTRSNPFAPLPIVLTAPKRKGVHPAVQVARHLFGSLLEEILHQTGREPLETSAGLEKFQRKVVASVAMRMQEDPKSVESVTQIAAEAGYSTDHFTRTFKKIMGCSPQQFLVNARITKARQLLLDSELSIKQLADQLGYCNAYFFSRQFKTIVGLTPSQYRNR